MNKSIQVNIEPFEILLKSRALEIHLARPASQRSAMSAVTVRGIKGTLHLSSNNRKIQWAPGELLPAGKHVLIVNDVHAENGKIITKGLTIPFRYIPSNSPVPKTVVVHHLVRLRPNGLTMERLSSDSIPPGSFIEVIKGRFRNSTKTVTLAYNERGSRVNFEMVQREMWARRIKKFGKLHPHLFRALEKVSEKSMVPVAVWLKPMRGITMKEELKARNSRVKKIPQAMVRLREQVQQQTGDLAKRMAAKGVRGATADPLAPAVNCRLTRAQVREVAKLKGVVSIFLRNPKGIDDLEDSIDIANSDQVQSAGFNGSGIRVAVWEEGPDDVTNLSIADSYEPLPDSSSHARLTHAVIRNTEAKAPHGHAPSCSLYSANDYDLDALTWAVDDAEATVISQSFHRDEEQTDGTLSYDDIYKDYIALHYPWPTILQASGNDGSPDVEYVNHKGYNSLAVGSHNDDATAMASDSVYRNPSSSHGDRELPELCANGTGVSAVGETSSGTSFAAPAAAGVTALLQDVDGTLCSWPEGNRAILLAGCRNVVDDTWWNDVSAGTDAADGSGAVDAYQSYLIARARKDRNNAASSRGWSVGTLASADFDKSGYSTFVYRILVPSYKGIIVLSGPRKVKVALAWNSKVSTLDEIFPWWPFPTIPIGSELTLDFDLHIYDSKGVLVGYSGSYDNSYEIAEFEGTPGETYEIKIRRYSGDDSSWYGIAWNVSGGFRLIDVWPTQTSLRRIRPAALRPIRRPPRRG
jgi:hypothetical protein